MQKYVNFLEKNFNISQICEYRGLECPMILRRNMSKYFFAVLQYDSKKRRTFAGK